MSVGAQRSEHSFFPNAHRQQVATLKNCAPLSLKQGFVGSNIQWCPDQLHIIPNSLEHVAAK